MARGCLLLLMLLYGVSALQNEARMHHSNASNAASPRSSAVSMSPPVSSSASSTGAPSMAPSTNSSGTTGAAPPNTATASSVPSGMNTGAPTSQTSPQPTTIRDLSEMSASTISSMASSSSSLGVTQAPSSSPAVSSSVPSEMTTVAPSPPPPPEPTTTWIPLKTTDLEVSGTPLSDPAMTTTPFGKIPTSNRYESLATTSSGVLTSPPDMTTAPPLSHSAVPSSSATLHPDSSMATDPSSLSPSLSSAMPTGSPSPDSTSATSSRTTLAIDSVLNPTKPNPVEVVIICLFVCLLVGGATMLLVWRYQRRIPRFRHLEEVTMVRKGGRRVAGGTALWQSCLAPHGAGVPVNLVRFRSKASCNQEVLLLCEDPRSWSAGGLKAGVL
ncbi:mucin-2-like isoform X2 [Pogoniulus pusillus]|uniref:mucin-2-like isoform X2 n=1 Tax=Pogoniulus pusillus TaxID=488313 RepID=UPI0030B974AC